MHVSYYPFTNHGPFLFQKSKDCLGLIFNLFVFNDLSGQKKGGKLKITCLSITKVSF